MNTEKILEKIDTYIHLQELYNEAAEQLRKLKDSAPEAYESLKDDIGCIALDDAVEELLCLACQVETDVIEMLDPTEPNVGAEEMGKRWDDFWKIHGVAEEAYPYFTDGLEKLEDCITKQHQMIVARGFDEELDILV